MANGFDRSRSPVRAINTVAKPAWGNAFQRPRSWSEAVVPSATPVTPLAPQALGNPVLACPGCGAEVRLELVPVTTQARPVARPIEAAGDPEQLPDFEESVRNYKKELIGRALAENNGVMTRASKALGLKYTTFVAMVHRLDLDTEAGERAEDEGSTQR